MNSYSTLYLNIFRGERDISEFDQTFTPIPTSSPNFSALVGSVLHEILLSLQPGLGQITTVSRLPHTTKFALLTLAFAAPTHQRCLSLPYIATRRFIIQKARRQPERIIGLRLLVGIRFQVLLILLIGVLFIFQSPYYALLVGSKYLALRGGPRKFQRGFPCSAVLGCSLRQNQIQNTGLSPSMVGDSTPFFYHHLIRMLIQVQHESPTTPHIQRPELTYIWFGLLPFRSPLLRQSFLLYFPQGTQMFQFPWFPLCAYVFSTQQF
eukprot:TRINITY_DN159_c0_g1_i11.p2 TRINITY_DN159_c0_g1~~TRINITY_DN159_c0_g1_i11.p2  ORF type:complete len:265 (+),score=-69.15 TRINITY_DN159_c0_g1_i11:978-1772(+)